MNDYAIMVLEDRRENAKLSIKELKTRLKNTRISKTVRKLQEDNLKIHRKRQSQFEHAIAILKGEVSDEFLLAWASELYYSISEDPTFGNREKAINNLKAWGTLLIQAHTKEKP